MKKEKTPSRNTKAKPSKGQSRKNNSTSKKQERPLQNSKESEILKLWTSNNIYSVNEKNAERHTYVIREMPTPVSSLSLDILRRKIYQDVFLKYELMQGNRVAYAPLWETFPFSIETIIIKDKKTSGNIVNFRKQCRLVYNDFLKIQQQKLQKLGVFADWTSSEKSLDARYETKLFSHFDRLREYSFLRDELKLSHWCPNCISPLGSGKTVTQASSSTLYTYVKFPLNIGFEEFGKYVYFAIHLANTQLWEVAGTIAIGITDNVTYWLTQYQDEFIIFAEPQLKKFVGRNANRSECPVPIAKLDASQLKDSTVAHPLYSLTDLPLIIIPDTILGQISKSTLSHELSEGIIPLNPAHNSLSYIIIKSLTELEQSDYEQFVTSTSTSPIFDETGRFTEDADTLCGLNLSQATEFISDELEARGELIKTRKQKTQHLQCQLCNGLSVSRPYRHWVFDFGSSDIRDEITNSHEYWDHYDIELRNPILSIVKDVSEMLVSSERQWGIPLPVLRCDNCNELISDKKVLRSVRSSIRRGAEYWFRLSVEELLPTETVCVSCNSRDFRKESTYIESYFANLLQALDTSDFKKTANDSYMNIAFVPEDAFLKWLGELSVVSASLQQSRPTKESQPYKNLKLNPISDIGMDVEIQEEIIEKYPADVLRLISFIPELQQIKTENDVTEQLKLLIEEYYQKYTQLKELFINALELNTDLQGNRTTKRSNTKSVGQDVIDFEALEPTEVLAISISNLHINNIDDAYQARDYFKILDLIFSFCLLDLPVYVNYCRNSITEKHSKSAMIPLTEILKILIQRLAPIIPFLAEDIYTRAFSSVGSIFEEKWSHLPLTSWDEKMNDTWESLKNDYHSNN